MNNEQVAWMHKTYFPNGLYEEDLVWSRVDENSIPLYTHPAELTDEEINEIADECFGTVEYELWKQINDFARAILRKAQEK